MRQAVLMDLDGTLIDSNEAHAKSWFEAFEDFGYHFEEPEVRWKIGMGGDQLLWRVLQLPEDSVQGQKISKRRQEIFTTKYRSHLRAFPGARSLIEEILVNDIELVIASSSAREDLKALLKQAGLDDLIEEFTSADDVKNSKPEPDVILAALAKTQANPQEAIMIGDTPFDIKAAAKAGVRTIAFTCGGWGAEELKEAIAIYEGPWQLVEEFQQSALRGNFRKQVRIDQRAIF